MLAAIPVYIITLIYFTNSSFCIGERHLAVKFRAKSFLCLFNDLILPGCLILSKCYSICPCTSLKIVSSPSVRNPNATTDLSFYIILAMAWFQFIKMRLTFKLKSDVSKLVLNIFVPQEAARVQDFVRSALPRWFISATRNIFTCLESSNLPLPFRNKKATRLGQISCLKGNLTK